MRPSRNIQKRARNGYNRVEFAHVAGGSIDPRFFKSFRNNPLLELVDPPAAIDGQPYAEFLNFAAPDPVEWQDPGPLQTRDT